MNKKAQEKSILEAFNRSAGSRFRILTIEEARKVFPNYNEENPDFIIAKDKKYIGVDLFLLSLDESIPPIRYARKTYKNQMHKQSQHPNTFSSIEEAKTHLQEIKKNPGDFPLTKQDDLGAILRQRLTQKMQTLKNYVTDNNWLIGHATEVFDTGIVQNIIEDNAETNVRNLISGIMASFPEESKKIEDVFLFEHNTGNQSWLFRFSSG